MHIHPSVCAGVCVSVCTCMCACACGYVCLYVCMYACKYVYTYTQTYIHTYIHICIYTYVYIHSIWHFFPCCRCSCCSFRGLARLCSLYLLLHAFLKGLVQSQLQSCKKLLEEACRLHVCRHLHLSKSACKAPEKSNDGLGERSR